MSDGLVLGVGVEPGTPPEYLLEAVAALGEIDIGAIATRGNLASLSSTKNNSAKNILCSILGILPINLSKVCPTHPTVPGGGPGNNGSGGNAGVGIPGLIGAGS